MEEYRSEIKTNPMFEENMIIVPDLIYIIDDRNEITQEELIKIIDQQW